MVGDASAGRHSSGTYLHNENIDQENDRVAEIQIPAYDGHWDNDRLRQQNESRTIPAET